MKKLDSNQKNILKLLILSIIVVITLIIITKWINNTIPSNRVFIINSNVIEPELLNRFPNTQYTPSTGTAEMLPIDWDNIVNIITRVYNSYDAIIINCAAETIPYLASALSFMLENISKPIVLTSGDILKTIAVVSNVKFPEVMVFSNGKLLRGCRTILHPYGNLITPGYPDITSKTTLQMPQEPPNVKMMNPDVNIIILKVFPGIDGKYMQNIVDNKNINGIILEIWNNGNIPSDKSFLEALQKLVKRGVIIMAVSYDYEPAMSLLEAGIAPGFDITIPAAYTKLMFLLSNVEDKKLIYKLLETNFRGEITIMN